MEECSKDGSSIKVDLLQQSDDIRTADMDISDEGEGRLQIRGGGGKSIVLKCFILSDDFVSPEPETIEEDEAELELQKQLEKQRKLKQKQLLKDSGEKVSICLSFATKLYEF